MIGCHQSCSQDREQDGIFNRFSFKVVWGFLSQMLQGSVVLFDPQAFGIEFLEQVFMVIDFSGDGIFDLEIFGTAILRFPKDALVGFGFGFVRADKFEALSVAFWFVPGTVICHGVTRFTGGHGERSVL